MKNDIILFISVKSAYTAAFITAQGAVVIITAIRRSRITHGLLKEK